MSKQRILKCMSITGIAEGWGGGHAEGVGVCLIHVICRIPVDPQFITSRKQPASQGEFLAIYQQRLHDAQLTTVSNYNVIT